MRTFLEISVSFHDYWRQHVSLSLYSYFVQLVKYQSLSPAELPWHSLFQLLLIKTSLFHKISYNHKALITFHHDASNNHIPAFNSLEFLLNAVLVTKHTLRKKCPYFEIFWSVFSRIWTEYGEIRSISQYPVRTWENTDQKNSKCEHFLHSDNESAKYILVKTIFRGVLRRNKKLRTVWKPKLVLGK